MRRLLPALALLAPVPTLATTGGPIGMLMTGRYDCELPGSAAGESRRPQPAASFTITSSSRYIAADGSVGTYLKIGKVVTMTSGMLAGTKLMLVRAAFLRRIGSDGKGGELRCVLSRASDSG